MHSTFAVMLSRELSLLCHFGRLSSMALAVAFLCCAMLQYKVHTPGYIAAMLGFLLSSNNTYFSSMLEEARKGLFSQMLVARLPVHMLAAKYTSAALLITALYFPTAALIAHYSPIQLDSSMLATLYLLAISSALHAVSLYWLRLISSVLSYAYLTIFVICAYVSGSPGEVMPLVNINQLNKQLCCLVATVTILVPVALMQSSGKRLKTIASNYERRT